MDPNVTWAEILRAYDDADAKGCHKAIRELRDWLRKDGFPPRITGRPDLDRIMVEAACKFLLNYFLKGDVA